MTRQTRTLVLLGAAVAVCAAGYAALRLWNQRQAEADDAVHLTTLTQATSFSFTNQNGDFSFTQSQEEGWQRTDDPDFPADQDALDSLAHQAVQGVLDSLVSQALSLTAVRTISDPEGLSSYGLDDPTGVLTVSYGDGQTMPLTLGALDETGSAWYALLDEDPIIYLIQSKTISTLTGLSAPYFAEE